MGPVAAVAGLLLTAGLAVVPTQQQPPPRISLTVVSAGDGVAEGTSARVLVSLDRPAARTVVVRLDTRAGSARGRADYEPVHTSWALEAGTTRLTVPVPVLADGLDEADETFVVRLSDAHHAVLDDDRAEVTVLDGDPPPRVLPQDATLVEPVFGNRLGFTEVRLSAPSGRRVVVWLATRPGTAAAGQDFVPLHPTLVFAPGRTTQPVSVELLADTQVEPPETIRLVVLDVRHAEPTRHATITLLDAAGIGNAGNDQAAAPSRARKARAASATSSQWLSITNE